MPRIAEKIKQVKDSIDSACIRSGRDPKNVKIVVVTKSVEFDSIEKVIKAGQFELGENRVQRLKKIAAEVDEYLQKHNSELPQTVKWHMLGHLQRNKVQQVLPIVSLLHSVDTLRLAEEINSAASKMRLNIRILLQVNTSNEPQKYGAPVGAAIHLAEQVETLPNIELAGLMTMAPLTRNGQIVRSCFARLNELFHEIRGEKIVGPAFTELSMGMSNDFEIAVEEGATIVRIGSAIFAG